MAATPSVFIQPSRGHNPIHTRLQPYPASSSARCPASPDGPPYSLDEHGSCRTSSESSTSPALRLLSSRRRWFLRRVFCRRRSARSERVHDALIGNQRCLRPARLGGRWGHHVGVGSRAGGDVVLPQGRRVGGFAAGLVAAPRQGARRSSSRALAREAPGGGGGCGASPAAALAAAALAAAAVVAAAPATGASVCRKVARRINAAPAARWLIVCTQKIGLCSRLASVAKSVAGRSKNSPCLLVVGNRVPVLSLLLLLLIPPPTVAVHHAATSHGCCCAVSSVHQRCAFALTYLLPTIRFIIVLEDIKSKNEMNGFLDGSCGCQCCQQVASA